MGNTVTQITDGTHNFTEESYYTPPKSPMIQSHLDWFRGLKLGFMVHWSPTCQLGISMSWPLSDGDRSWSQKDIDWVDDVEEFKAQYKSLNQTFNPVRFRPDKWARLAKECGFKYLLFTTKHHDGFCMFDTKTTDYRVTHDSCPFSRHKYANVTKELFQAFRSEGLAISAYFSKPDWHCDAYWHKAFGTASTRNVNYAVEDYPELWEEFVQYTHRQLRELTSQYGHIDTLWLDGGWVRPDNAGQDIRLGEIIEEIRSSSQPHLIVCDRTVGGEYENIVTPEQTIPSEPMRIPWETCLTMGKSWSYSYDDVFKSTGEIVRLFVDILSKGGSMALNVTPRPDGELPREMVHRLRQFGKWVACNREGIYETTISDCQSLPERGMLYTHKQNSEYLFYLYDKAIYLPSFLIANAPMRIESVHLLRTGQRIPFTQDGGTVVLDTSKVSLMGAEYADCFVFRWAENGV